MADLLDMLGGGGSRGGLGLDPIDSREANTLSLLEAMQQVGEAGQRRTASPLGSIAQVLAPIFAAPIQARRMEQRSALESLLGRAKLAGALADIAKANSVDSPKNLEEAITRMAMAGKDPSALVGLKQSLQKPAGPANSDIGLLREANPGLDAAGLWEKLNQSRTERMQTASDLTTKRTEDLLATRAADERARRANSLAVEQPEYRAKTILDKNTLQPMTTRARTSDLEAPDSFLVALDNKDMSAVRGAKQIIQQITRLKELIPQVLPKSRAAIPITIGKAAVSEKPGALAAEFDRLAQFEKMKGIREFISPGRLSDVEIREVGGLNRYADTQDRAFAKVKAMEDLITGDIAGLGLNSEALYGQKANTIPHAQPTPPLTEKPAPQSTAAPFEFFVAPDQSEAAKQVIADIYRKNPNASDEEVRQGVAAWMKGNAQR